MSIKEAKLLKNCGAASVCGGGGSGGVVLRLCGGGGLGVLQDNLVSSTEIIT